MAPILGCVEGGVERAVDALRWAREEALAFVRKYDSIPPADLQYLSIDEICAAAAVDPRRPLKLAVDWIVKISLMETRIELAAGLTRLTRVAIKNGLKDNGFRDRRLLFEITGILPSRHVPGPLALTRNTRAQQTEAPLEAQPAESPGAMAQPWRRTVPGKVS